MVRVLQKDGTGYGEDGSVNIDNEQELASQERIEVVPTLVLYKNGQAVDSIVGPGSKAAVEDFIRKNS